MPGTNCTQSLAAGMFRSGGTVVLSLVQSRKTHSVAEAGGMTGALQLQVLVRSFDRAVWEKMLSGTSGTVPEGGRAGDFSTQLSVEFRASETLL